jgi:hypothetical protein
MTLGVDVAPGGIYGGLAVVVPRPPVPVLEAVPVAVGPWEPLAVPEAV